MRTVARAWLIICSSHGLNAARLRTGYFDPTVSATYVLVTELVDRGGAVEACAALNAKLAW